MNYADNVRAFVVANFLYGEAASLRDNTSFLNGGILDSTGILELVTFLESTYGIEIETQELLPANLDSVNNVAQFLSRKLAPEKAGPPCLYAPQPVPRDLEP